MRVHITGASGFIGKALLNYLKKKHVNFIGYSRTNISNLKQISSYKNITADRGDVLIHLAQNSSTETLNIEDEINTLEILSKQNWKHIIYASSSAVYGNSEATPHFTYEPVFEHNDYTKVKINSEEIVKNINGTSLRFTNIYGPNMKKNTVLGEIKNQINDLNSKKIILNELESIKDFIFIDDVVISIYKSLLMEPKKILNIGTGTSISIRQLAKTALMAMDKKDFEIIGKKKLKKLSINSVNIEETELALDWQPKIKIFNGLKIFLNN